MSEQLVTSGKQDIKLAVVNGPPRQGKEHNIMIYILIKCIIDGKQRS